VKLYGSKPPKPQRTFTTNLRRQITFIQIIVPSLKVPLESKFKASRNFKDFGPSKLHRIQALKSWRTSTTNLWRWRPFKEPTKNKKYLTSTQPEIHLNFIPKIFQSTLQSMWRTSCVQVKTIDVILELKTFLSRSN